MSWLSFPLCVHVCVCQFQGWRRHRQGSATESPRVQQRDFYLIIYFCPKWTKMVRRQQQQVVDISCCSQSFSAIVSETIALSFTITLLFTFHCCLLWGVSCYAKCFLAAIFACLQPVSEPLRKTSNPNFRLLHFCGKSKQGTDTSVSIAAATLVRGVNLVFVTVQYNGDTTRYCFLENFGDILYSQKN